MSTDDQNIDMNDINLDLETNFGTDDYPPDFDEPDKKFVSNETLEFQAISHINPPSTEEESSILLNSSETSETYKPSFWSMSYYQQYFDVNTSQVFQRLQRTLIPWRKKLFASDGYDESDSIPDLYCPFWIATTLVFIIAALGNFASYLSFSPSSLKYEWHADIGKLSSAAVLFYFSISLLPFCLWLLFRRLGIQRNLLEIISTYGYSFFIFIPACFFCMLPYGFIRWLSIIFALFWSVILIIFNLIPPSSQLGSDEKTYYYLLAFVIFCHSSISFGMKYYFFDF